MPETSPQNKQILKKLLAEPGNKHCADCKTTTHPRWASWNIGIFLCIRCSGVHRSLGTHISKVRSVDLDSWSDTQLVELQRWGNAKANQYWEAGLPGNHVPDESKIVNFIRTKYDLKRWAAQEKPQPDALSAVSHEDVPLQQVKDRKLRRGVSSGQTQTPAPQQSANLLDFDSFESAPPVPGKGQPSTAQTPSAATTNISRTPSLGGSRTTPDIFSAPSSRYAQSRPTKTTSAAASPAPAPAPAPAAPRADLKKSILSLYAQKPQPVSRPDPPSAPSVTTTPGPLTGNLTSTPNAPTSPPSTSASAFDFDLFAPNPSTKPTGSSSASKPTSSLIDSLGGLSFDSPSAPSPAPAARVAPIPSTVTPSSNTVNSTFAPVEEDDFFANPWK